jgi:hypothetical protein
MSHTNGVARRHTTASPPTLGDAAGRIQERTQESSYWMKRIWRVWFWYGLHGSPWEHMVSIDLGLLWRRHLVWAKSDGDQLRNIVTSRFANTIVFLTLLVSAEIGTLFSPSQVVEDVRVALQNNAYSSLQFWTGIVLCISIYYSIGALLANFTAWSIFVVVRTARRQTDTTYPYPTEHPHSLSS